MTASGRLNAPSRLVGALAASVVVLGGLVACGGTSTEPSSIAVTGVTLDRSTLSLTVGSSVALAATVSPSNATNTAVTWSSSNSAVASVSDAGVVSAVALGTATITAATQDGAQTATCAVTVVAATVDVTGVTLDKSTLDLAVGAAAVKLIATVTPEGAKNKNVIWLTSNTSVATVSSSGEVTPVAAGTATITVKTVDGAKVATCSVKVTAVAVTGVTLDKSTLDLAAGGAAVKLVATVTPSDATNKDVTWLSSNTSVATVSASGVVTPVAAGTATITVKTVDGAKLATCSVTVAAVPVAVTGVTLNKATLTLTVNSTESLVEAVTPANATDKVVSWFSDKPTLATVSTSGVVTAKAPGKAIITVTTHDGSYTASCEVTVKLPSKPVTGVALDVTTLDLVVGGSTKKLTATVSPADADNPAVTWSSSDNNVAKVDAGVVTAVGSGTAIITVKTAEGQFTATCAVTVHSDAVTSLTATYPVTGRIALTWKDPSDPNAKSIEVTTQTADGPVSKVIPLGTKKATFVSLEVGTSYEFAARVHGASDTTSEQVTVSGTPVRVLKLLHTGYAETVSWGNNGQTFYLTDSNGSSNRVETHDCIIGTSKEFANADFPTNYRWMLMPGLADPTDPGLVSLKSVAYNKTTKVWEETQRYLHVDKAKAEAGTDGLIDNGQYYNWTLGGLNFNSQSTNNYNVFADLDDHSDSAFNANATFRMIAGAMDNSISFVWYADSATPRRLLPDFFHVQVRDSSFAMSTEDYGTGDYNTRSSWWMEDIDTQTP